jgi:tetratricopeptide (TPR) repeat protein
LRELGRHEEALAAFEAVMREFPRSEVAPTARAETLRELGRHEEALAAFEAVMREFPRDEVARNARAKTLRELGRHEEALAAFEAVMREFPRNEVAPTARAETLRELGRYEEALAAFEETIARFPRNEVARNARAYCLASMGRLAEAEQALPPAFRNIVTRQDWVALHMLAMARLRGGQAEQALADLERGARECPFPAERRYFETALPLALMEARRAAEAAHRAEALAADQRLPPTLTASVKLVQAHALAEIGDREPAARLLQSAEVIDFSAYRQRRLAATLSERYGLGGQRSPTGRKIETLNATIIDLEAEMFRVEAKVEPLFLARAA